MRRRTNGCGMMLVVFLAMASAAWADVPTIPGSISRVTVYRGQALVTRSIPLDLPKGSSEVVVSGLPEKIIPESLYAQGGGSIVVLSVRYRERAVAEDTREEVRKIEGEMEKLNRELYQVNRDLQLAAAVSGEYNPLWKLAADGTNVDLNRSILQAEPVEKLTAYLESKRTDWHQKSVKLEFTKMDIEKEIKLRERKLADLAAGRSRTEREAVVFLSRESKKGDRVELSYLVRDANWLTQYNLRAVPDQSTVLIEYNAVVNQTSGEDWSGVALSLSTAEPMMVASAPDLEPMQVMLASSMSRITKGMMGPGMNGPNQMIENQQPAGQSRDQMRQDMNELAKSRQTQSTKGAAAQMELNVLAMSNQWLEFQADQEDLRRMQEKAKEITRVEGVSVTYRLPGSLVLPSRTDQQMVTIARVNTKADFTLLAAPLLTDYVYLQGELLNDSDTIFLPGPASMFRNGEFVGRGQMSLVTIGGRFTAGFGIDSQVQVTRELIEKKRRIQGGNAIDTYLYRMVASNYKKSPVKLRLMDRLPYTDDSSVKIEMGETKPSLSKDAEYVRTNERKGILRWDLTLQPQTTGEKATAVSYSYTMEYDRNMHIQPKRGN